MARFCFFCQLGIVKVVDKFNRFLGIKRNRSEADLLKTRNCLVYSLTKLLEILLNIL